MQPIHHGQLLLDADITLTILRAQLMRPQRQLAPLLGRLGPVRGRPAIAHEEHVAGPHVAALGRGSQVEALRFANGEQLRQRHRVRAEGVVGDAIGGRPASVVKQDASPHDAMARPVVDAAAIVGVGAFDIGGGDLVGPLVDRDSNGVGVEHTPL
jgi:hypothetical protein